MANPHHRACWPLAFCETKPRAAAGFTLIELMIAVLVVAVLAAIALPAYQDSIRKSRRSDAVAEVSRVQQAEERFRANNTTYSGDVSSNASTGLRLATGTTAASSYDSSGGYYNIAVSGNAASTYTVTVTAKSGLGQDNDTNCQCMQVNWSGGNAQYLAANSTSGSCASVTFVTTNAASCWRR